MAVKYLYLLKLASNDACGLVDINGALEGKTRKQTVQVGSDSRNRMFETSVLRQCLTNRPPPAVLGGGVVLLPTKSSRSSQL